MRIPFYVPAAGVIAVLAYAAWQSPPGPVRRYRVAAVATGTLAFASAVVTAYFLLSGMFAEPWFSEATAADRAEERRSYVLAVVSGAVTVLVTAVTITLVVLAGNAARKSLATRRGSE